MKQIVVARAEQIAKLGAALKTEPLLPLQESLTIIACAFQQLYESIEIEHQKGFFFFPS